MRRGISLDPFQFEGVRQKVSEREDFHGVFFSLKGDGEIGLHEFREHLTAGAAGQGGRYGTGGYDCKPLKGTHALGDGGGNRRAFRAEGQAVGTVFNVATGDDSAIRCFQRGADGKARIGGIRLLGGLAGGSQKRREIGGSVGGLFHGIGGLSGGGGEACRAVSHC